jgi:mono/diheme cytochrome c family protein
MNRGRAGRLPAVLGLIFVLGSVAPAWGAEAAGARAFARQCSHCHSASAESPGTLQLALTRGKDKAVLTNRKDLSREYIQVIVRNGLRSMPAFTPADLPDAELTAIAAFIAR